MGKFEGKVVIVTGASSGFGEATAVMFAKEGANLVITGRNKERLTGTGKRCKDAGAQVLELVVELAKFENLEPIINQTVEKFGRIDVLVNNAGLGGEIAQIEALDKNIYDTIFEVNLRAPVFLSKFALPHLRNYKGCIVNVSSCFSMTSHPHAVPYSMTKAGLDHFTRGLASECASSGVRVNCINPGVVQTRIFEAMGIPPDHVDALLEPYIAKHPLGLITSEDVAKGVLFLAEHHRMTGVTMPIDGGYLIN